MTNHAPSSSATVAGSYVADITVTQDPSEDGPTIIMADLTNPTIPTSTEKHPKPQSIPNSTPGGAGENDTTSYLSGLRLSAITVALGAAIFLVAMDVNIIATAIPRISAELQSLDDVGWYGS